MMREPSVTAPPPSPEIESPLSGYRSVFSEGINTQHACTTHSHNNGAVVAASVICEALIEEMLEHEGGDYILAHATHAQHTPTTLPQQPEPFAL